MKKVISAILLVSILAACTVALANVEFIGSTYVYKKAGSGKTSIVIKRGSVLEDVDTYGKYWTKVELSDGSTGWVRTKYVKSTTKDVEDAPVIYGAGGYKKSSVKGDGDPITAKKIKATGRVNIRDGASLSSKVLGTLQKGKTLPATGKTKIDSRGVTFYEVKYNGKIAYVSSGYSEPVK